MAWVFFGMMYTISNFKMYYKKRVIVLVGGEGRGGGA